MTLPQSGTDVYFRIHMNILNFSSINDFISHVTKYIRDFLGTHFPLWRSMTALRKFVSDKSLTLLVLVNQSALLVTSVIAFHEPVFAIAKANDVFRTFVTFFLKVNILN